MQLTTNTVQDIPSLFLNVLEKICLYVSTINQKMVTTHTQIVNLDL